MDKTLELSAGRLGVRIPGRGKCLLKTIAIDARVKYPLYLTYIGRSGVPILGHGQRTTTVDAKVYRQLGNAIKNA